METIAIAPGNDPAATWAVIADRVQQWVHAQSLSLRDVVVLAPYQQLLAPARRAFGAGGGWLPRIETTDTLAQALGPPAAAEAGPTFDVTVDRLAMGALLRRQSFGVAWERRDRRAFGVAVRAAVDAAHALARAAQARSPAERARFEDQVQAHLAPHDGPGALESLLLRVAAAWAASANAPATDRLFTHRPAAWVAIYAGGADELVDRLLAHADGIPRLCIDADAALADTRAPGHGGPVPTVLVCDDFESEAFAAASQVIEALERGCAPVALIALDRVLVRRARALLERCGARIRDETGWKLSTTRAAARIMAWLRASADDATADDRLDWLKGWPRARDSAQAMRILEARWRHPERRWAPADAQAADDLLTAAAQAWAWTRGPRSRPLADWIDAFRDAWVQTGEWPSLIGDAAGKQVVQTLRLAPGSTSEGAWEALAAHTVVDLDGFTAWIDRELEDARFVPDAVSAADADVILTPLASAVLRPFGAVVMPGVDASHLGAAEPARGLIGEAMRTELGLDSAARRRERERLAFAQVLRHPQVVLTRRRLEGDEPLPASPDLLAYALRHPLQERLWQGRWRTVESRPVSRPSPSAARALPASLSASQVEALRLCPYRFFARAVLRLQTDDEIDRSAEKRDYGTWLHAVLHRFHQSRAREAGDDDAALAAAAEAELALGRFDAADMLPFRASFEVFAPDYLAWLRRVESDGWRWQEGEIDRRAAPAALAPTTLRGRIDRLDAGTGDRWRLIDYKTVAADTLKGRVKEPLEDTQLAFYAALWSDRALEAAYLTLDGPKAPELIEHVDVADSAAALLDGLGGELERLRAGAGMTALGEGRTCDQCEARGLCRRDGWSDA